MAWVSRFSYEIFFKQSILVLQVEFTPNTQVSEHTVVEFHGEAGEIQ